MHIYDMIELFPKIICSPRGHKTFNIMADWIRNKLSEEEGVINQIEIDLSNTEFVREVKVKSPKKGEPDTL